MPKLSFLKILLLIFIVYIGCNLVQAQTSVFTYQGKLTDLSAAANGPYDFTFRLFDSASGGAQIGTDFFLDNVQVSGGIFTVNLDFGTGSFAGGTRFLEILVRTGASTGTFTVLTPRQEVTSAPYSVKSLSSANADTSNNSLSLGGVTADQFVQTTDPRLSDDRNPLPNSPNYIQNTTSLTFGSFNLAGSGKVSGTLTANTITATNQYNIGPNRILAIFDTNLLVGRDAGLYPLAGLGNSLFGTSAGQPLGSGNNNSFFGYQSGQSNNTASNNSYFGKDAGRLNNGSNNSFFGEEAGSFSTGVDSSTFIGYLANSGTSGLTNAAAIGARAIVFQSNSLVLGSINGINGATADTNVGIGTTAPNDRLDVTGIIRVSALGAAGSTALCRNASNQISTCSSSLRYKTNINPFGAGLKLVTQLSPISFNWKEGGTKDLGLGAEDVAKIEPLLVTYNDKGEVEGVKYDRVGVVLINAVKEQQQQIEQQNQIINQQNEIIKRQQVQLDSLKSFICSQNQAADFCRPKN